MTRRAIAPLPLWIPEWLFDALKERAQSRSLSLPAMVRELLELSLVEGGKYGRAKAARDLDARQ
jgi:hypothetical protein